MSRFRNWTKYVPVLTQEFRIAIDLTQSFCFGDESQQMPCNVYNSCSYVERDMQHHLRRSLHLFPYVILQISFTFSPTRTKFHLHREQHIQLTLCIQVQGNT